MTLSVSHLGGFTRGGLGSNWSGLRATKIDTVIFVCINGERRLKKVNRKKEEKNLCGGRYDSVCVKKKLKENIRIQFPNESTLSFSHLHFCLLFIYFFC